MLSIKQIDKARYLAIELHSGQFYGSYPYIKHCEDVFKVLKHFKVLNEEILIAALLHDTIEDTPITYIKICK